MMYGAKSYLERFPEDEPVVRHADRIDRLTNNFLGDAYHRDQIAPTRAMVTLLVILMPMIERQTEALNRFADAVEKAQG